MRLRRFVVALGALGVVTAALVFLLQSAPTLASNDPGGPRGVEMQAAPPLQGPTLAARTPDLGDLPPIDLGELGSPVTATPESDAEGVTEVVIENDFEECSPIEDEFIKVECVDGNMAFTRYDAEGTRWIYYRPELTDALIETNVRMPSNKNGRYGVIFRMDESGENFYILGVTNEGEYGLFRFAEDHYETLIPYTESFSVGNASFPSQIKIVNQGETIAINIGGQWLDSIRDDNLTSGRVALFFEPDEPNQTVLFDELRISEILSPLAVPEPRVIPPADQNTSNQEPQPTEPSNQGPQPTQTPFIIVVTATPTTTPNVIIVTATPTATNPAPPAQPTRQPTRVPTTASDECPAPGHEAWFYISNSYPGTMMRFTIGGGAWGTHDYDIPGDAQYYIIKMPPGKYTYTAFIPGKGKASGERTQYNGGQCYSVLFAP